MSSKAFDLDQGYKMLQEQSGLDCIAQMYALSGAANFSLEALAIIIYEEEAASCSFSSMVHDRHQERSWESCLGLHKHCISCTILHSNIHRAIA